MNMQSAIAVKSNGTLINNVRRRSLPRKPQKRKQKLRLRPVPLKRRQKLRLRPALLKKRQKLKLPPVLLKKKRKLKLPPALLRRKRKLSLPPVPLKRNELPAEKQKPAPAKKRLPALLLTKGFQKKKLNVFLRREPEPAKPLHRKLPLMPLPLIIPKSRNMGTFQRKKSVISVKKQFARDTKICLQLTLTVKLPRRKRKRKPKLRKQKKM